MSDETIEQQDVTTVENEIAPESQDVSPETAEEPVVSAQEAPEGEPATPDDDDLTPDQRSNQAWARMRKERKEAQERAEEAAREAAYLKGRLESAQKPEAAPQQPAYDPRAPFSIPRPTEDDFETYGDYELAKDEWLVSRAKHEARIEATRELVQRRAQEDMGSWMQQAPTDMPDFLDKVTLPSEHGGAPLSIEMVEICRNSKVGHQLLYQLASDPKEVMRLRSMPPHLMALEIGRREAKLSVSPAPGKKLSDAPAPIKPVTPAAASISKSLEDLPLDEYMLRRNQQEFGPDWKPR